MKKFSVCFSLLCIICRCNEKGPSMESAVSFAPQDLSILLGGAGQGLLFAGRGWAACFFAGRDGVGRGDHPCISGSFVNYDDEMRPVTSSFWMASLFLIYFPCSSVVVFIVCSGLVWKLMIWWPFKLSSNCHWKKLLFFFILSRFPEDFYNSIDLNDEIYINSFTESFSVCE